MLLHQALPTLAVTSGPDHVEGPCRRLWPAQCLQGQSQPFPWPQTPYKHGVAAGEGLSPGGRHPAPLDLFGSEGDIGLDDDVGQIAEPVSDEPILSHHQIRPPGYRFAYELAGQASDGQSG